MGGRTRAVGAGSCWRGLDGGDPRGSGGRGRRWRRPRHRPGRIRTTGRTRVRRLAEAPAHRQSRRDEAGSRARRDPVQRRDPAGDRHDRDRPGSVDRAGTARPSGLLPARTRRRASDRADPLDIRECDRSVVGRVEASVLTAFPESDPIRVLGKGKVYNAASAAAGTDLQLEIPLSNPYSGTLWLVRTGRGPWAKADSETR